MTTKTNIQAGYKDSSVGVIPQEWEVKRIKDICNIDADSLTARTSPDYEFEYISLSDVDGDSFDITTSHQIFKYAPSRARRIVKKGDVVISTVRPNLQGFFLVKDDKKDLVVSTGFSVLTPICCDSQYLLSCFFSSIIGKQFYSLVVGSNYPAVNSSDVAKLKLPIPPIEEQRKIAEILSVWDEAIEKQCRLIERLEERKRALMQRLLTGRMRIHGFNTPWQKVKLGEICKRVIRRNEENCQNVMTISAQRGFVSQTDFFNKSVASSILDNYYLVLKNEFCYNKSYSNGYPMGAIKRLKETEKAVVTTLYICFSVADSKRLNINFFEQYCEYGGLNRGLSKVANEGGRAHGLLNVTPSDFFGLKLLLPSNEEQKAIAEVLTTADDEIATHRKKLDALRLQKRGLMQQLLTGKTRVKV